MGSQFCSWALTASLFLRIAAQGLMIGVNAISNPKPWDEPQNIDPSHTGPLAWGHARPQLLKQALTLKPGFLKVPSS